MVKATGHILKSNDIELQGRFHLDVGQVTPTPAKGKNAALATPQVRIVESQPEFAVMKITCSCGTKTYIRCEYPDVRSSGQETQQTQINGENDNAN
jgi:hypothetical protein